MAKKKVAGKSAKPARAQRSAPKRRSAASSKKTARKDAPSRPATRNASPKAAASTRKGASSARLIAKSAPAARTTTAPVQATVKPRSSGLNRADLAKFRELLLLKRAELLGDVTRLRDEALSQNRQDAAGNLSSMPLHPADIGSDHYEQEFTLGLIESERAMLAEIDEALKRIEAGTYGVCAATGRPIGKTRLRAQPWTKYCYEYVLEREQGRTRRV